MADGERALAIPSEDPKNSAVTQRLRLETGAEVHARISVVAGEGRPKCVLIHGNPGSLSDWDELVAQVAAARWPARVAGLVLLGTLGAPAHGTYRLLSLPGAERVARTVGAMLRAPRFRALSRGIVRRAMRGLFSPEPVTTERLEREMRLLTRRPEILVAMVHVALGRPCERLLDTSGRIRCPTLFLHGTDDAIVPARCARSIHDRIVGAGGTSEFELLAGAGHMLIERQPADVASHVRRSVSARS